MAPSTTTIDIAMSETMRTAIEAAKAGGDVLLKYYSQAPYNRRYKEDTSLQTTADLESEQIIIDMIKKKFPTHSINSEERGLVPSTSSYYTWLIDPLDGTENFVLGIPYFSSSITLCVGGEPQVAVVYNPITEDLYTAEKGKGAKLNGERITVSGEGRLKGCRAFFIPDFTTKRLPGTTYLRNSLYMQCRRVLDTWSPALDWCLVASGKVDILVTIAGSPIHPDAGTLILAEAEGKVTDFHGNQLDGNNNRRIVGCNKELHRQVLQLIKDCYAEDGD